MNGKCPKCDAVVLSVRMADVTIRAADGRGWLGVSYACMACNAVLSVQMDPIALKTDTVTEVVGRLRRGG